MVDLDLCVKEILASGPSRVLVLAFGGYEGVPSKRAREQYGTQPDVIFIRGDGWSLGATRADADAAYRMWKDEWVAFMERPETVAKPIAQWGKTP